MKTAHKIRLALALAAALASAAHAQLIQGTNLVATNIGPDTPVVIARDANSITWGRVKPMWTNAQGQVTYRTNKTFTELTPDKFRQVNGQWVETSDAIQITAEGGACTNGHFSTFFAANLNTSGSIRVVSPDPEQKEIRTHLIGLSYFDYSQGSNVLIAIPQDRTGTLISSNTVLFSNAFSAAFRADVRYRLSRSSIEQDVVLVEKPPFPDAWSLNPATTRLQCWTEVVTTGDPGIHESPDSGQDLDFGVMQMVGPGKAFFFGNESDATPVRRTWVNAAGRTILLEEIEFSAVASRLQSLPEPAGGGGTNGVRGGLGGQAGLYPGFPRELPPPPKLAQQGLGGLKVATAAEAQAKPMGLVLDYTLVASLGSPTCQGNSTYLVTSSVTLSGNITIEGGAVFKFSSSSAKMTLSGPLISRVSQYRPITLTSMHDDSVGDVIAGSSGSPTNTGAIYLSGGAGQTNDYKYIRASYAATAITNANPVNVWHSQFINCGTAVSALSSTIKLRNVLIANATNCVYTTNTVIAEHLTADNCVRLFGTNPVSSTATNCLLTAFVNTPSWNNSSSCVYLASNSGVYTNVGGGHFYLTGGAYRDWGNTEINATLRTELKKKTTWPPLLLTNDLTTDTVLAPYAPRNSFTPDIGWHYDPLDYLVSNLCVGDNSTPITLLVTNGTAIGVSGSGAFNLQMNSSFVSEGAPLTLNYLVPTAGVQEQGCSCSSFFNMTNDFTAGYTMPAVGFRFTDAGLLGLQGDFFWTDYNVDTTHPFCSWILRDSVLHGLNIYAFPLINGAGSEDTSAVFAWTNNVFERPSIIMGRTHYFNLGSTVSVSLHNNLFWQGSVTVFYDDGGNGYSWPMWELADNVIDNGSVYYQGYTDDEGWGWLQILNNAYVNASVYDSYAGTAYFGSDPSPVTISAFNYADGPLGRWYHSSTDFHNAGSRNADLVGLYQFTTTTNQVKETNSPVDIGFHYVALNGSGQPVDTSGGGVPDYLADSNGNGSFDVGIDFGNWAAGTTVTDTNGVAALKVYTPLK
jgi:hypothetical protein